MARGSRNLSPMAWVYQTHRWLGLLSGWLLFVICVTGTLVVYKHPLKVWSNPTLVNVPVPDGATTMSPDEALHRFRSAYPQVTPRLLAFPSDAYSIHSYSYAIPGGRAWINPQTGHLVHGLPSDFADFVQRLHAGLWMGGKGRWVVGALGILMFGSLLTGLIFHWRRLGRDLFHLRLRRTAPRKAWSDLHKFSAVWLLGFHLLIALTGAWLGIESLVGLRNPPAPNLVGQERVIDPMPTIERFLSSAHASMPELTPTHINFAAYGQGPSSVRVQGELPGLELVQRGQTMVVMHAEDASLLGVVDRREQGLLAHVLAMMRPLHYGYFGGPWMELAYLVMGAACSMLVFSGLAVWCSREADAMQRRRGNGHAPQAPDLFMARLNVGVTQGLLLSLLLAAAVAQLNWTPWPAHLHSVLGEVRFAASHNLLGDAPVAVELWAFLITWGVLALALSISKKTARAWMLGWLFIALLLVLLPCLSAMSSGGWQADWQRARAEPFWIAMACFGAAVLSLAGAWHMRSRHHINSNQERVRK
ncbi:PepSY-associated TM helix domain-containing protein [Diaphorobacter caeni]|uniref:PepSY-associated TM helix domain-containing protein n=1 Tax=Diaphorobacter caeni TaxID=2784387 RepID=UPI00188F3DCE|nr:PepSY-associated TM helix domain-containing protein [Diaphorobacter caeni]MBF5005220.1 PepSY domain-containing protein [Diaphorobacter caeni]